jgi:serine/threonine protein kinase
LEELHVKHDNIAHQHQENLRHLEYQLDKQKQNKDEVVTVDISFRDGDPRLEITGRLDESDDYAAILRGCGRVICQEIRSDDKQSGGGSRHVEIYHCISIGTFVQSFYGIAELDGKRFAVMQDIRNDQTIAAAIESRDAYDPLTCIRFAYELASTVAYLHSVGIIIKNISDTNVIVVKLEGGRRIQPRLTNLEQARRVSGIRAI